MIRYDLICNKGHGFDGWFRDSAAYDAQAAAGHVACAVCGSTQIEKQLMAPGIPVKGNRKAEVLPPQKVLNVPADPKAQQLLAMMRELRAHVEKHAENVGHKFAEEARKIHYGETEKRGIFGETTGEEAIALLEEGIEVHPLPKLPEDGN
jgi:hypothetical protein